MPLKIIPQSMNKPKLQHFWPKANVLNVNGFLFVIIKKIGKKQNHLKNTEIWQKYIES